VNEFENFPHSICFFDSMIDSSSKICENRQIAFAPLFHPAVGTPMSRTFEISMRKVCMTGVSLSLLFLFSVTVAAQETPAPPTVPDVQPTNERLQLEKTERDRPVTNGLKIEKKLTGRLPNGYRNVVNNKQRDDIYAIQKDYAESIELLKIRIELLEQERDKQVDAVLTSEQVQKIKQTNGVLESEKRLQKKEAAPKRTKSEKTEQ
jgi:hypothetical protein